MIENQLVKAKLIKRNKRLKLFFCASFIVTLALIFFFYPTIETKRHSRLIEECLAALEQAEGLELIESCDTLLSDDRVGHSAKIDFFKTRSKSLATIGRFKDAISDINQAINLAEDNPYLYKYRGWLHEKNEDQSNAIASYEQAISLNPDDTDNIKRIVNILYRNSGSSEAENYILSLPEDHRNEIWALSRLATLQLQQKKYTLSKDNYELALDVNPYDLDTFTGIITLCRLSKDHCLDLDLAMYKVQPNNTCSEALVNLIKSVPNPKRFFSRSINSASLIEGYAIDSAAWIMVIPDYAEVAQKFYKAPTRQKALVLIYLSKLINCTEPSYLDGPHYNENVYQKYQKLYSEQIRRNFEIFATHYAFD